jgi:hypothetical protein
MGWKRRNVRFQIWSVFITKESNCFPRSTSSTSSTNSMDVRLDSLREIWVSTIVQIPILRSLDCVSYDNPCLDSHPKSDTSISRSIPPLLYSTLVSSIYLNLDPLPPLDLFSNLTAHSLHHFPLLAFPRSLGGSNNSPISYHSPSSQAHSVRPSSLSHSLRSIESGTYHN